MTIQPEESTGQRGGIPVDSFANRLMLARAHAGHLSIREAADLCDLGRGAWTNWEKGARPADIIDIATVVADKLGVDRDWLLFGGQLADAQARSLRRRGPGLTGPYDGMAVRLPITDRPADNRPAGRPLAGAGSGVGRTGYLDRGARRRRDR